jgi:hypothetical protein
MTNTSYKKQEILDRRQAYFISLNHQTSDKKLLRKNGESEKNLIGLETQSYESRDSHFGKAEVQIVTSKVYQFDFVRQTFKLKLIRKKTK